MPPLEKEPQRTRTLRHRIAKAESGPYLVGLSAFVGIATVLLGHGLATADVPMPTVATPQAPEYALACTSSPQYLKTIDIGLAHQFIDQDPVGTRATLEAYLAKYPELMGKGVNILSLLQNVADGKISDTNPRLYFLVESLAEGSSDICTIQLAEKNT